MRAKSAGILCFLLLVCSAAFADSLDSIAPSSFFQYDTEAFATLQGTQLFGNVDTQIIVSGPAGTFLRDSSGGSHNPVTGVDTVFLAIPDEALLVPGQYSVTVQATDDTAVRLIGPVFFNVVTRAVDQTPLMTAPEAVVVEATSASGATATFDVSVFSFIDPSPVATCDHLSGSFFPIGTTNVQCSYTDAFGTVTATFPVRVTDTVGPVIQVPANILSTSPVVTYTVTASDNVDGSAVIVFCSPASGATFPVGTTTVSCHAEDLHANTSFASFKVTVTGGPDAPVLTLPNDIVIEATGASGAVVTFTATATDNATVLCTPASGSTFAVGLTTVACSASSPGGTSSDTFAINVVDTTAPVLTLPGDINAAATGPDGAAVTYTISGNDLVDGPTPASCNYPSGSVFPIGTTLVQCGSSDSHFNTSTGSFNVTVSADNIPPVLSLPANIIAEATGPDGAVVSYLATANDNVDGPVPVLCTPPSGSTFPLGLTTVQCSATDAHNNTAHGSFTIFVQDTTPPTIVSITATPNNLWPPDHKMYDIAIAVIASDLVDPAPVSHIVSVTTNQSDNANGDGNTPVDWTITGPLTLQLRAERDSNKDRVYTITIATTDASGNTAHGTVTVTVSQTSNGKTVEAPPANNRNRAVRP
jgi:hypothetical protein